MEDDRYEIRQCNSCGFQWKSPQLPYETYLDCYEASSNADWFIDEAAIESRRLKEKIEIMKAIVSGSRVLDIGCWFGQFLARWNSDWQKFAIEPNGTARKHCADAGITIIGNRIEDMRNTQASFDIICLMDVLEHLPNPSDQLELVVERLRPGGGLVIETGDTDCLLAKVMGADWHYYGAGGHISFYSQRPLRALLERHGLTIHTLKRLPHMVRSRRHVVNQWYQALRFKWPVIRPRHTVRTLMRELSFPRKEGTSPWLTGVCDHIFVIGLKDGCRSSVGVEPE